MDFAIAVLSILFGGFFVINLKLRRKNKQLEQTNEDLSRDKAISATELLHKQIEDVVNNTDLADLVNRDRKK